MHDVRRICQLAMSMTTTPQTQVGTSELARAMKVFPQLMQ